VVRGEWRAALGKCAGVLKFRPRLWEPITQLTIARACEEHGAVLPPGIIKRRAQNVKNPLNRDITESLLVSLPYDTTDSLETGGICLGEHGLSCGNPNALAALAQEHRALQGAVGFGQCEV